MAEPVLNCQNLASATGFEAPFAGLDFDLNLGQRMLVLADPQRLSRHLLLICATLKIPSRGLVTWFGRKHYPLERTDILYLKRRIGLVHRHTRLISNMTLIDNLVLGTMYHKNVSRNAAYGMIQELMARFHLTEDRLRRPAELAFAKQRLGTYIREIAKRPRLYIFENASTDLDQYFEPVMEYIEKQVKNGEAALLMSEGTAKDMLDWVDRVLVMTETGGRTWAARDFDPYQHSRFVREPDERPRNDGDDA